MIVLLFLSCSESKDLSFVFSDEESKESVPEDSTEISTIGVWDIGEEESCSVSGNTPSWEDMSGVLWGESRTTGDGQPAGCLALIPDGEDWIVAGTTKDINVRWGKLYSGVVHDILLDPSSVRLRVADIDGDGALDAVAHSRSLHIGWGFTTSTPTWEEIVPRSWDCQFRDLVIVDIEGDGDLDILVAGLGGCEEQSWEAALLENLGGRVFSDPQDISVQTQIWGVLFDSITVDIDGDLDLDIYMCNDFGENVAPNSWLYNDFGRFYIDDNRGSDVVAHCMGVSMADLDHNGYLDMYVTGNGNHFLLLGDEDGWYEAQANWSMPSFVSYQMPWGSQFLDYDNDGLLDLMVSTSDFAYGGSRLFPTWMLRQNVPGTFVEVGEELGLPQEAGGRGIIAHDINADGVLDFLMADAFGDPWMFLSQGCTQNNWIEIEAPHGSIVRVQAAGKEWMMLASEDPGFAVYQPSSVHIGLGDITHIDRIDVSIPYVGEAQLVGPITARRRLKLHGL